MMNYKLRAAKMTDHDLIYALKSESVRPYVEEIWGWDEEFQKSDFNSDFKLLEHFHVVEVNEKFAGFVQCFAHDRYIEIAEIHLLPQFRGMGIGSDIIRKIMTEGILRHHTIRIGCFQKNLRALNLYQRLGFVQIEGTDTHALLQYQGCTIIPYNERYRDDMIFMVLEAKNALGRTPRLNEDLLDIQGNYLDTGDMFWLALDANDRVIGCIGYNSIPGTTEVKLHRLYVKFNRKRQGIGTALLQTAEAHIRNQGKTTVYVHLGGKEYFESHSFYPKHGYVEYKPSYMKKVLD